MTANAVTGNEEMFLQSGFQDFIAKPVDAMLLDSIIRRWMHDKSLMPKTPGSKLKRKKQP
jgi:CheY-like chemotaxis protein